MIDFAHSRVDMMAPKGTPQSHVILSSKSKVMTVHLQGRARQFPVPLGLQHTASRRGTGNATTALAAMILPQQLWGFQHSIGRCSRFARASPKLGKPARKAPPGREEVPPRHPRCKAQIKTQKYEANKPRKTIWACRLKYKQGLILISRGQT